MLGNQIAAGTGSIPDFIENHKAGKIRVVAVMGTARQPLLPDVPTFADRLAALLAAGTAVVAVTAPSSLRARTRHA